jgi:hypothetical protein
MDLNAREGAEMHWFGCWKKRKSVTGGIIELSGKANQDVTLMNHNEIKGITTLKRQ